MVAVRSRVPALACLARRRRPALRAPSPVEPAEGGPRQGLDGPSGAHHQRRGRSLIIRPRAMVWRAVPLGLREMAPDSDPETLAPPIELRESWEGSPKNVCIVLERIFDHEKTARP